MNKIYYNNKPKQNEQNNKNNNYEQNRKRNVVMNFRVTPTEKQLIDARIKLTGLSRSDFFIMSCMYQKILVKGNIKTFSVMRDKIHEIAQAINKTPDLANMDPEQRESLRIILEILQDM